MKVEFYKHNLGPAEIAAVQSVLESPFLTTGPKTQEFETEFSRYLGTRHTVGLNSCTAGLFLALKALGIGPGDEVIVPAMTFIASANVVLHCGATPVLVDVEADTGLIDAGAVRKALTKRTKAIMPVHLYGHLADMRALRTIADEHKISLIEDAAHAIESARDGVRTGALSEVTAYSFYATKNIACGEGGAITTGRDDLNDKIRILRQHGMSKSAAERYHGRYQHWDMLDLGYKYNMSDIQAALLLPQLTRIETLWAQREAISRRYEQAFQRAGVDFPIVRSGAKSARHMFTVWAPRGHRDDVLKSLQERQVGVAVNYRAIHLLTYFQKTFAFRPGQFPVAEEIGDRTITIPLYPKLTDDEIEYVIQAVIESVRT